MDLKLSSKELQVTTNFIENNYIATVTRMSVSNEPREASKDFVYRMNDQEWLEVGEGIKKNNYNSWTMFYFSLS